MSGLISVIIPCRNGANYLPEAVAGILRQKPPVEIIVIDDGSTDHTAAVAKNLGCAVTSIAHSGLSRARNIGVEQARGEFVLFHDHDDVLRGDALALLHTELLRHDEQCIVMAQAMDFISPELDETEKKTLAPRPGPYYGLLSGAVLMRKSIFGLTGLFTEDLATGQTMDFLLRAERAGAHIEKLGFIAVDRRLHANNMGRTMQKQEHKDYSSILRAKLKRT